MNKRNATEWFQLGICGEWDGGGGVQKEEEIPYAERNDFHVFLNVKKCKDGQETSQE